MLSNFYSANVTTIKLERNVSISMYINYIYNRYSVHIAYTCYTHYDSDTRSLRYASNGNSSLAKLFAKILRHSYQPLFYFQFKILNDTVR